MNSKQTVKNKYIYYNPQSNLKKATNKGGRGRERENKAGELFKVAKINDRP